MSNKGLTREELDERYSWLKDELFCSWLESNIDREDVKSFLETVSLAMCMHPRAVGDMLTKIEPLHNEFVEKGK